MFNDEDLALVRKLTLDSPADVQLRGGAFTAIGISHLDATKIKRLELSGFLLEDSMAAELYKLDSLEELSYLHG